MNSVQFNAVCFIASTIMYSAIPNVTNLFFVIFVSIIFAVSYFKQVKK